MQLSRRQFDRDFSEENRTTGSLSLMLGKTVLYGEKSFRCGRVVK
jgi:hypothetical protein